MPGKKKHWWDPIISFPRMAWNFVWNILSSCWKFAFGGNDSSKANPTGRSESREYVYNPTKAKISNSKQSYIRVNDKGQLDLVVADNHTQIVVRSINSEGSEKYLVYLKIGENVCRIADSNVVSLSDGQMYYNISSVANQDGKDASGNLDQMREKLGLKNKAEIVKITEMSGTPFEAPEVETPAPPVSGVAPLAKPNPQQIAVNGQSVPKAGSSRS